MRAIHALARCRVICGRGGNCLPGAVSVVAMRRLPPIIGVVAACAHRAPLVFLIGCSNVYYRYRRATWFGDGLIVGFRFPWRVGRQPLVIEPSPSPGARSGSSPTAGDDLGLCPTRRPSISHGGRRPLRSNLGSPAGKNASLPAGPCRLGAHGGVLSRRPNIGHRWQ